MRSHFKAFCHFCASICHYFCRENIFFLNFEDVQDFHDISGKASNFRNFGTSWRPADLLGASDDCFWGLPPRFISDSSYANLSDKCFLTAVDTRKQNVHNQCLKMFVQRCKIWAEPSPNLGKFRGKITFWAPIISSVGNLRLCVG